MGKIIATIPKNARESVKIELTEFKGHDLVDLRVYADNGAKLVPTRKGITVGVNMLPSLVAALTEAEREAREAGLLT